MLRIIPFLFTALLINGCAAAHYRRIQTGELHGRLVIEWVGPDQFVFVPDADHPLTFTRHNMQSITPGRFYTDGGSIPRALWGIRNYSPWGYGPAYVIHDWLFHMKYCRIPGFDQYDPKEAAIIMSEVMKTLMEKGERDKTTLYLTYEAVSSPVAARIWETGLCKEEPRDFVEPRESYRPVYVLDYP